MTPPEEPESEDGDVKEDEAERAAEPEEAPGGPRKGKPEGAKGRPSPETLRGLRERIHEVVDEALSEALHVRSKGRVARVHLAREMGRVGEEVRRAIHAASEGMAHIDVMSLREGLRGRRNTLMTRLKDEDLDRLDTLVDAGLFESRSACAAFLIHAGLESRRDLVDKVEDTAKRIADLKAKLQQELAGEA